MDVEYISLLDEENSDDEDRGADGALSNWGAGAPVRVPRSEHIDRTALINTDASSRKGKADLKARGNESQFEDSVQVKDEPADEENAGGWPPSPGTSRRVKVQPPSPDAKKKEVTKSPSKARGRSSSAKPRPLFSSLEEKEELERDEFDRLATLQELAGSLSDAKIDTGGDTEMVSPCFFYIVPPPVSYLMATFYALDRRRHSTPPKQERRNRESYILLPIPYTPPTTRPMRIY